MPHGLDLIVRNGTVVTAAGTAEADLLIRDGRFVAIEPRGELRATPAVEEYDATGLHVLPGVIDGHVHFREPGLEYKEDWRTGSMAAAFGGVTTVIDMPNTVPPTDTAERVAQKRALAEAESFVDFGVFGLLTAESVAQLRPMAAAGVVGFKCFLAPSTGDIAAPDDAALTAGLREVAALGRRIGFHAEDEAMVRAMTRRLQDAGRHDALAHLESRPAAAEVAAIERVCRLAGLTRARVHILHLSSGDGLAAVTACRAAGIDITCEASAHHVFLGAEQMDRLGSRLRINPPVRLASEGHGAALLTGLRDGRIQAIASDHAPHTAEEKLSDDIWAAASGFPGVETAVRFFLTLGVDAGRMTLQEYARASSEGPAKTWDLYPQKGAIRVGSDGDLTIIDLARTGVIRDDDLHSRTHVTPYDGTPFVGAAVGTIVRGRVVMRDGQLLGAPAGRMVLPTP